MALTADNVRIALTGAVYVAPVGTTVPTAIDGVLDNAFKDLGYLSDEGVTITPTIDVSEVVAWQNQDTVRRAITRTHEISFTAIETNVEVLKLAYASAASSSGTGTKFELGSGSGKRALVIDCVDGGSGFVRHVAPIVELTDIGDIVYVNGDPVGYELTLSVFKTDGVDITSYHSAGA